MRRPNDTHPVIPASAVDWLVDAIGPALTDDAAAAAIVSAEREKGTRWDGPTGFELADTKGVNHAEADHDADDVSNDPPR